MYYYSYIHTPLYEVCGRMGFKSGRYNAGVPRMRDANQIAEKFHLTSITPYSTFANNLYRVEFIPFG